ncbi:MAG TPA: hypothetical protein VKY53_11425 [Marinobacter sp.]|nr:hypothetical protein [Marinobacter sp.]
MEPKPVQQQNDYVQVRDDLRKLQDDVAKLAASVAEGQRSNIGHLKDEIRKESRAVFERLCESGDAAITRARSASDKAIENVEHKIEERPFLSVVLLFLAGLLVGRMLDR